MATEIQIPVRLSGLQGFVTDCRKQGKIQQWCYRSGLNFLRSVSFLLRETSTVDPSLIIR